MKTLDLTQLGGFPFTQNALLHMEEAYSDIAKAIVETTTPVIISGLKASTAGTTTSYTEGFVAYQGEVVKVAAGSHHISAVDSAQIKIVTLTTTLIYDNGSTHAAKKNKVGEIVQDNTGTFLIKDLIKLHEYRAAESRREWVIGKDDADGYCRFQVDKMTKVCTVQGWTRIWAKTNADPPMNMSFYSGLPMGEFPDGMLTMGFGAFRRTHQEPPVLGVANVEIRTIELALSSAGSLSVAQKNVATAITVPNQQLLKYYFNFSYPIQ